MVNEAMGPVDKRLFRAIRVVLDTQGEPRVTSNRGGWAAGVLLDPKSDHG